MFKGRLLGMGVAAVLAATTLGLSAVPAQAATVTPQAMSLYDIYTGADRVQQCMADGRAGLHIDWSAYRCAVYHDGAHEALWVTYL